MGVVYLARQEPIGRLVAIKVLQSESGQSNDMQRFVNEARILSQLRHPHSVKLLDFGYLPTGQLFIAMDYLPGGTLADLMARGRVDVGTALRIARQVTAALAEAHGAGIVHRDLKPSNILFDHVPGEPVFVKVADYGIAHVEPAVHAEGNKQLGFIANLTAPGTRLGSPAYISPEQAFGRPVDARSDLYTVGLVLHELVAGHRPFSSDTNEGLYLAQLHEPPTPLNQVSPDLRVDPDLEALVLSLLAKQPEGRPAHARLVVQMIDVLLRRLPEHDLKPTLLDALPRPVSEAPVVLPTSGPPAWAWGLLVVGLLALLTVVALR